MNLCPSKKNSLLAQAVFTLCRCLFRAENVVIGVGVDHLQVDGAAHDLDGVAALLNGERGFERDVLVNVDIGEILRGERRVNGIFAVLCYKEVIGDRAFADDVFAGHVDLKAVVAVHLIEHVGIGADIDAGGAHQSGLIGGILDLRVFFILDLNRYLLDVAGGVGQRLELVEVLRSGGLGVDAQKHGIGELVDHVDLVNVLYGDALDIGGGQVADFGGVGQRIILIQIRGLPSVIGILSVGLIKLFNKAVDDILFGDGFAHHQHQHLCGVGNLDVGIKHCASALLLGDAAETYFIVFLDGVHQRVERGHHGFAAAGAHDILIAADGIGAHVMAERGDVHLQFGERIAVFTAEWAFVPVDTGGGAGGGNALFGIQDLAGVVQFLIGAYSRAVAQGAALIPGKAFGAGGGAGFVLVLRYFFTVLAVADLYLAALGAGARMVPHGKLLLVSFALPLGCLFGVCLILNRFNRVDRPFVVAGACKVFQPYGSAKDRTGVVRGDMVVAIYVGGFELGGAGSEVFKAYGGAKRKTRVRCVHTVFSVYVAERVGERRKHKQHCANERDKGYQKCFQRFTHK